MLCLQRGTLVWMSLLLCSTVLHVLLSWRVGQEVQRLVPMSAEPEVEVIIERPPEDVLTNPAPPEAQLELQHELEFDPPDLIIAPKSLTLPQPDVSLALRAQGRGFQGIEIPSGAAFVAVSEGSGVGGFKTGIGNGLGDGAVRFAPFISGLREAGLDVVFCVDATGSMGWVIKEVKDRIEDISKIVRSLVPISRFGFVAYRDRDDPEFTTRVRPLTYSNAKLYRFLSSLKAEGGGDWFEAIDLGLKDAIDSSGWRVGARKVIILIGDAPPAEDRLDEVVRIVKLFRQSGGIVSALDVSDQANPHLLEAKIGHKVPRSLYRNAPMQEFLIIGEAGQGDTATLDGEIKLTKRLIKLIIGDQFAAEMQALLDVL